VNVRVEVRQVPEGLHEQDQAGPGAGQRLGVRVDEQSGSNAAQLTQPRPMPAEDGAQELRQGEHVLAMRDRLEDILLDPFAVEQHALLVVARAEVAGLAGECEQIVVAAGIAVDAGEAVMRIAAFDETLDRARFHGAAKSARFAKLLAVALGPAPQGACARVARAINTASWRTPRCSRTWLAAS
jgi:hypothetical protein